jgi:hypothetical protein
MPIVDREIIREKIPYDELTTPKVPLGIFIEMRSRKM